MGASRGIAGGAGFWIAAGSRRPTWPAARTCRCTSLPPARSSPQESGPRPFTTIVRASTPDFCSRAGSTDSPRPATGSPGIPCSGSSGSAWAISAACLSPGSGSRWTAAAFPSSTCRSRAWRLPTRGSSRRRARESRCVGGSAPRCGTARAVAGRGDHDRVSARDAAAGSAEAPRAAHPAGAPRGGRRRHARSRGRPTRACDAVAPTSWRGSLAAGPACRLLPASSPVPHNVRGLTVGSIAADAVEEFSAISDRARAWK